MINTGKYEGHTKGEYNEIGWRIVGDDFVMNGDSPSLRYIAYVNHSYFRPDEEMVIEPFSKADANLIADSPLLLEEVKRLHGLLNMIVDKALHEVNTQPNGDESPYNTILNIAYEGVIE